jgi:hypothetical protein
MITIQKVTSTVQSVPPPVSRHLLTRRTVFSKTVFSIAWSTFRMYSVMAIFISCLGIVRQVHRDSLITLYLLSAIGLTPGDSSTVHIYTQTIHKTTQSTQTIHRTTQLTNWEKCRPCPVFASYTLAFALQLREKARKNLSQGSRRVPAGTMKKEYTWRSSAQLRAVEH